MIRNPSFAPFRKIKRNFFSFLTYSVILLSFFFFNPHGVNAASGGRIGGGSFNAQQPSLPSTRSLGGYGGNNYGSYGNGFRGGGIGFPFLLPIFGFGGGGLLGFLLLMSIVGVVVNSIRGSSSFTSASNNDVQTNQLNKSNVSLIQLQMGLLATAKEIQNDLRELAKSSNTSTSSGLQRILQDTTLSLLRKPDLWVYSNLETGLVPYASAESTFNRISITERSKLKRELTSNYSGQINISKDSELKPGESDQTNEYILVTIIIATNKDLKLSKVIDNEQIKNDLRILGSISSDELIALEIIWQPDGEGESLRKEELITQYPNLKHL